MRTAPLSKLVGAALAAVAVAAGGAAAAQALGGGPLPPPKPLAQALYAALHGPQPAGFSASFTLTNRLFEGANLTATGTEEGVSSLLGRNLEGRIWASKEGLRVEIDNQRGEDELLITKHSARFFDLAENTVYELPLPGRTPAWRHPGPAGPGPLPGRPRLRPGTGVRSLAQIERALARLERRLALSPAQPTDIGGRPAYAVRATPKEKGSLLGAVELAFDATYGVPLRLAVYPTSSPAAAALELELQQVSYGPVEPSVFEVNVEPGMRTVKVAAAHPGPGGGAGRRPLGRPRGSSGPGGLRVVGHGLDSVWVAQAPAAKGEGQLPESTSKLTIDGAPAQELASQLGTLITYVREGVRYTAFGLLGPARVEAALAR